MCGTLVQCVSVHPLPSCSYPYAKDSNVMQRKGVYTLSVHCDKSVDSEPLPYCNLQLIYSYINLYYGWYLLGSNLYKESYHKIK